MSTKSRCSDCFPKNSLGYKLACDDPELDLIGLEALIWFRQNYPNHTLPPMREIHEACRRGYYDNYWHRETGTPLYFGREANTKKPDTVDNKREFLNRSMDRFGEFGNVPPSFNTTEEAKAFDGFDYALRSKEPGFHTIYNLQIDELDQYDHLVRTGQFYWTPAISRGVEATLILQGEITRTPLGLELYYSTTRGLRMKQGFERDGRIARGLKSHQFIEG